jgi:flagellar capping protein FliD
MRIKDYQATKETEEQDLKVCLHAINNYKSKMQSRINKRSQEIRW